MTSRSIYLTAAFWAACALLSFESLAADRHPSRSGWRPTKAVLVSGDLPDDSSKTALVGTRIEDSDEPERSPAETLPHDEMSFRETPDDELIDDKPDSKASEAPGKASASDSPPTGKSKAQAATKCHVRVGRGLSGQTCWSSTRLI